VVEGLEEDQIKEIYKDHAWFVAYAPSENPKIAVAVIVEHGEHGSSAAAPIASALIDAYLSGEALQAQAGNSQASSAASTASVEETP